MIPRNEKEDEEQNNQIINNNENNQNNNSTKINIEGKPKRCINIYTCIKCFLPPKILNFDVDIIIMKY